MNIEHQLGGAEGEGGDGEDVEVIVLDDHQYCEVFDTSLEVDMLNISLQDHDYSKGERSKEVREGERQISINNGVIYMMTFRVTLCPNFTRRTYSNINCN